MRKKENFEQGNKKERATVFTTKQLFWFVLGVLITANAIIFLILGLINDYASIAYSPFEVPNNGMKTALGGIDFKWFGVITFILGTIIYSLALSFATKTQEREQERVARRKQRRLFSSAEGEKVVSDFSVSTSETAAALPPESK